MIAVADSTILIHLAKIGKINLLKSIFDNIVIEDEVYKEIIKKEQAHGEISLIKSLIDEKFIAVKQAGKQIEIQGLHEGEKKSIFLCKELQIENILIDEEEGFKIATMFGLTPIRTTTILIILLDKKLIRLQEYESLIKRLSESGYFLNASTYDRLLQIGRSIAK